MRPRRPLNLSCTVFTTLVVPGSDFTPKNIRGNAPHFSYAPVGVMRNGLSDFPQILACHVIVSYTSGRALSACLTNRSRSTGLESCDLTKRSHSDPHRAPVLHIRWGRDEITTSGRPEHCLVRLQPCFNKTWPVGKAARYRPRTS
jgi:hypothetical protein